MLSAGIVRSVRCTRQRISRNQTRLANTAATSMSPNHKFKVLVAGGGEDWMTLHLGNVIFEFVTQAVGDYLLRSRSTNGLKLRASH